MTDTNEAHRKRYILIKIYIYTEREENKVEDFICHVIKSPSLKDLFTHATNY